MDFLEDMLGETAEADAAEDDAAEADAAEDDAAEVDAAEAEAAGAADGSSRGRCSRGRGGRSQGGGGRGSGRSRSGGRSGRGQGGGGRGNFVWAHRIDREGELGAVATAENKAWSQQMHKRKQRLQMHSRSLKQSEEMQKLAEESGGVHRRCKVTIKKETRRCGKKSTALAYGLRVQVRRKGKRQRTGGCFALSWSAMCDLAFSKDKRRATLEMIN